MIWPFVGFKVYGTRCFRAYETRNQSPAVKHGKTSSWCQHWTPRGDISGLHLHSHHPLTCAHTPPRISLNQQHHGRTTCKNRSLSASAAPSRSLSGLCGSLLSLSLGKLHSQADMWSCGPFPPTACWLPSLIWLLCVPCTTKECPPPCQPKLPPTSTNEPKQFCLTHPADHATAQGAIASQAILRSEAEPGAKAFLAAKPSGETCIWNWPYLSV